MTEVTPFERQLSGEIDDLMGPLRPVDDAAIFTAVAGTRSPRWTTRPMFSAIRLVVAGAVVAVFGALLLTGLITQPNDVQRPAVPSATSMPLPFEELEPGVSRILVDGDAAGIAAGPDGSIWRIGPDRSSAKHIAPLQGSSPPDAPIEARMIEVGSDGVVWVAGPAGVASWGGQGWTLWSAPLLYQPLAILPAPDGAAFVPWLIAVGDGPQDFYAPQDDAEVRMGVDQLVRDGARVFGEQLVLDGGTGLGPELAFASTPDGEVWAAVPYGARSASGDEGFLWRWDGRMWQLESGPRVEGNMRPRDVAVGANGSVWVYLDDGRYYSGAGTRRLARLEDGKWTVWAEDDGLPRNAYRPNQLMTVGHDGAVWMPTGTCTPDLGIASFDGVTSKAYLADWCVEDIAMTPDGSIWASGRDTQDGEWGLFLVTQAGNDDVDPGIAPMPDGSADAGA